MTTFSLGQKWVSQVTKSEHPDVPVMGPCLSQAPSATELNSLVEVLARSETAREISRRKWISPRSASGKDKVTERGKSLFEFLTMNRPTLPAYAMFKGRRPSIKRGLLDEVATIAWIAHVTDVAREQTNKVVFESSQINSDFIFRLAKLSTLEDGPKRALDVVKDIGIRVVIESGLPGMSVDGVSFHKEETGPVLALTLSHDRLDNFWFTLLHEIGHIVLHLSIPSEDVFVDSVEEDNDEVELEAEANAFAKDSLIPRDTWMRSDARRHGNESSVVSLARQLSIHPAIVAGRIRFERRDYRLFTNLIGLGEVRRCVFEG